MSYTLSITADNEVRIKTKYQNGKVDIHQKIISLTAGPESSHYTYSDLKNLAAHMINSSGLRKQFPKQIALLAWLVASQKSDPPRKPLAQGLKFVCTSWITKCSKSHTCTPAPNRQILADPAFVKYLSAYKQEKERL